MSLSKTLRILAAGAAAWAYAAQANAEEFEVPIYHLEISDLKISPKVGDTIVFLNRASIAHNLYVTYEDGEVETLDTQPPGTTKRLLLKQKGHAVVRCWIHPIIRMDLDVVPE